MIGSQLSWEEFKQARLECDRARRAHLQALGDAKFRPPVKRTGKLPPDVLPSIARSIEDGVALDQIVDGIWHRYGYASAKSCRQALLTRLSL